MIAGRFTRNNSLSSHFIRWAADSPWSHIEAKLVDYKLTDKITLNGWLGSKPGGGVQVRKWDYDPKCEYQEFSILTTPEVEKGFYDSFVKKIGCPYDWSAIFGFAFSRDWHKDGDWFCSEAFEDSLEDAGDGLFRGGNYWRITPGMFFLSPRLNLIK